MTSKSESDLRLEIGHVLFIDLVGYSKLLIEEQKERLRQLTDIVLATTQVAKSTNEQLVRLPTEPQVLRYCFMGLSSAS